MLKVWLKAKNNLILKLGDYCIIAFFLHYIMINNLKTNVLLIKS